MSQTRFELVSPSHHNSMCLSTSANHDATSLINLLSFSFLTVGSKKQTNKKRKKKEINPFQSVLLLLKSYAVV